MTRMSRNLQKRVARESRESTRNNPHKRKIIRVSSRDSRAGSAFLVIRLIRVIRGSPRLFTLFAHVFLRANARALPQERFMNITKNLGMLLLAIYLILVGITALFHVGIPLIVTGILALAAGILILIGR